MSSSKKSGSKIPSTNVGYKLLQKAGWKSGTAVNEGGIKDPVMPVNVNRNGKGLGCVNDKKKKKKPRLQAVDTLDKSKERQVKGEVKKSMSDRHIRNMLRTDIDDDDEVLYHTFH
ncbi:hypothetical protein TrCOL_g5840 [Triparma columacea]|uniref:G-patch domain-containing protein n=1 Tax=Triparma columacea TaxID=722753 RepID=A0A9W7GL72_9STRA|nr:hypothetical protein TrCOL_g5840 [Triparma columacea]